MAYRKYDWKSKDGTRMSGFEWQPDNQGAAKAVVCIVHGMGEHMGRYNHVADMLTSEGYAVLGFDQRGHGQTEGKRGHVPIYDALLEGPDWMLAEAARAYPGVPVFLYGHSMGGNLTLNYVLRRKPAIAGAIVTGPWLMLAFNPPRLQVIAGRILERIYPNYTNNRPANVDHLTTDPEMAKMYKEDPLGHGSITARFFFGVQRAGLWALAHASEWNVPLLLMHGGDDRVTSIAASRLFAERAGSKCNFREWNGFQHELHNELNREDVFAAIREWIREQLSTSASVR